MPKISTTMRPDDELEVSDHEVGELKAFGILHKLDGQLVERESEPAAADDVDPAVGAAADDDQADEQPAKPPRKRGAQKPPTDPPDSAGDDSPANDEQPEG